jgi:WD40 repeat protein
MVSITLHDCPQMTSVASANEFSSGLDILNYIFSPRHRKPPEAAELRKASVDLTGRDNTIRIWQKLDGREIMRFPHDGSSSCFGFDPSGKYLRVSGGKRVAKLLCHPSDLATKEKT